MLPRRACLKLTMLDSRGKYTLEELLNAKRAERPSPEFWSKFENDLRIKQRRLLQKQPVEDLGQEVTVWHRFRNFGLLAGAATSCGIVGFVVMQMLSSTVTTESVGFPVSSASAEVAAAPIEATGAEIAFATVSEQPAFFEVIRPEVTIPRSQPSFETSDSLSGPVELASSKPAEKPNLHEPFVLEIGAPFQSIDIDSAIAFNADENITSKLMEKYVHPLSDRGWKYTQYVSNQADPLNRISEMALESKLFRNDPKSEIKWNALTLKF